MGYCCLHCKSIAPFPRPIISAAASPFRGWAIWPYVEHGRRRRRGRSALDLDSRLIVVGGFLQQGKSAVHFRTPSASGPVLTSQPAPALSELNFPPPKFPADEILRSSHRIGGGVCLASPHFRHLCDLIPAQSSIEPSKEVGGRRFAFRPFPPLSLFWIACRNQPTRR